MKDFIKELRDNIDAYRWSSFAEAPVHNGVMLGEATTSNAVIISSNDVNAVQITIQLRDGEPNIDSPKIISTLEPLGADIDSLVNEVKKYQLVKEMLGEEDSVGDKEVKVAASEKLINKYFKQ